MTKEPQDQPQQDKASEADVNVDDVRHAVDEANEKGYYGPGTDPTPNEEYSLESGPESPPAVPDNLTRANRGEVNKDGV